MSGTHGHVPHLIEVYAIALTMAASFCVPTSIAAEKSSPLPDFSGEWGRDMLFFEPPESGPGPVTNLIRKADGSTDTQAPCCAIVVTGGWLGNPNNPILKPDAAEAVKQYGQLALSGTVAADLHNSCWPEPPPFPFGLHFGVHIAQRNDEVTMAFLLYNTVRHIRLNSSHPRDLRPSWQGDSIGRFEGDTLVVDTVGIRAAPISTVDAFGTPHSTSLHVVERFLLIDGAAAAEAQRKNGASFRAAPPYGRGTIDPDTSKKGLQIEFTVEDEKVFTTPWSGRVTYRPTIGEWPESVCAENPHFLGSTAPNPTAPIPDF